jgi:RNA polymerase sigma-70 factor (ECF subfamily)
MGPVLLGPVLPGAQAHPAAHSRRPRDATNCGTCRPRRGPSRAKVSKPGPFRVAYAPEDEDEVPDADESEAAFVARLVARDETAFNHLVVTYERRVFALVYRMLGRRDEAEDLSQEVFVQVFKAIDQFRGESKLSTWVYRIAVNLCKNRTKYLARRHANEQDDLDAMDGRLPLTAAKGASIGDIARPDELVEGMQLEDIVRRSIARIDPDFREVLVLRDVEDMSYEEIAAITGLPDGTVKSRIHRARAQLKTMVERALGGRVLDRASENKASDKGRGG